MTLGEKITLLRNEHNLSQGDLAEKLNVSRQSVSKWETRASIPELDKLIQLSDLFHVSIDELVRAETVHSEDTTATAPTYTPSKGTSITINNTHTKISSTQKIIGFILLGAGLLCCILGMLFLLELFLLGMAFILYGAFCLIFEKYAGLIIGWLTIFFMAFTRRVFFKAGHIFLVLIILFFLLMVFITIRICIKERIFKKFKKKRN